MSRGRCSGLSRRLITIPVSHFCEKARWALDRAGLEYVEDAHVQGVHIAYAMRAARSRTLPVLVDGETVLRESEDILRYTDAGLFDGDVTPLCRELDATLGPAVRQLIYVHVLPQKAVMAGVNFRGVPAWERRTMLATWGLSATVGKRYLGIGADTERAAYAETRSAFDRVAAVLADDRPFLGGDTFSAADITFAALAAAVLMPPQHGIGSFPVDDLDERTRALVHEFRGFPAGRFGMRMYEQERRKA